VSTSNCAQGTLSVPGEGHQVLLRRCAASERAAHKAVGRQKKTAGERQKRYRRQKAGGTARRARSSDCGQCFQGSSQVVFDRAAASIVYQVVILSGPRRGGAAVPDEAVLRRRALFSTPRPDQGRMPLACHRLQKRKA